MIFGVCDLEILGVCQNDHRHVFSSHFLEGGDTMIAVCDPKLSVLCKNSRDRTEKIAVKVGFDIVHDVTVDVRVCDFDPVDRYPPLDF